MKMSIKHRLEKVKTSLAALTAEINAIQEEEAAFCEGSEDPESSAVQSAEAVAERCGDIAEALEDASAMIEELVE